LPAEVSLQTVEINGRAQAVRLQDGQVSLPLVPGTQDVALAWREPRGIATRFDTTSVDLGIASVNTGIEMRLGADRWVLLTGGPRLGPAVLFWGVLAVIALVAVALGRSRLTPLGIGSWFLLAVGLSQAGIWAALAVVGWLLALAARARIPANVTNRAFDTLQLALALLTLLALMVLFYAIQQGLLGSPDMQIAGNGSSAHQLNWFHDRSDARPPTTWVISVPLLAYRLLMLAWALWLAAALLGWLKWGWRCYTQEGIWRPWRPTKLQTPTVVATAGRRAEPGKGDAANGHPSPSGRGDLGSSE
jgi:hypothetical protein